MKIRNVLKEYEAHLQPTQTGSTIQGKSEWKHHGNGTYRFKLSIRNIPLSNNSKINVILDEIHIASLQVMNKRVKIDTENQMSIGMPHVKAGQ